MRFWIVNRRDIRGNLRPHKIVLTEEQAHRKLAEPMFGGNDLVNAQEIKVCSDYLLGLVLTKQNLDDIRGNIFTLIRDKSPYIEFVRTIDAPVKNGNVPVIDHDEGNLF